MITKILITIRENNLIEKGDKIIAGISGGPDSVCLLHILNTMKAQLGIKIYAVHINHMLRGQDADCDQLYVKNLCESLKVSLYTKSIDVGKLSKQKKISIEEAGREARYKVFDYFAHKVEASKIAVGHNKNDQAETVLMNIIRGTGIDGLKGMAHKNGRIIRPLLDTERKDIENYCIKHSLEPRHDNTNLKSIYIRNKIRLDLIPYIDNVMGTDVTKSICRMSRLIHDDYNFLESSSLELLDKSIVKKEKGAVWLNMTKIQEFHLSMGKRVIRHAIRMIKGDLKGIESIHIENVMKLCLFGKTGSEVHLPNNIRASRIYETIKIFIDDGNSKHVEFDQIINIPGITYINELRCSIKASIEKDMIFSNKLYKAESHVQFFDYERLLEGINIRNRKSGDVFKPYKGSGTKKLKDYFIDKKIPREIRNRIPLVAKGNEIVWIIGYNTGDRFKLTKETKSILKLEYTTF